MNRRHFIVRSGILGSALTLGFPGLFAANQNIEAHLVRKGDTLSGIALKFGTTVSRIKQYNQLKSDTIYAGQKLNIPVKSDLNAVRSTTRHISQLRDWRYIVAHHSAIERGNAAIYDRAHRRRGMEHGLAYHFVIGNGQDSGNGEIEIGNRWLRQLHGGHVRKAYVNEHGIGICLVGNFENHAPTQKQKTALIGLVNYLNTEVISRKTQFAVHKEIDRNHTVCPGRHFPISEMHRRFS